MFKIPLAALAPVDGEPWMARHEIVVAPSAGAYRYLHRPEASTGGRDRVLALGNPQGEGAPLPGAEREAREVGGMFEHSTVLLGSEATEAALVAPFGTERPVPDVIHLACHGLFNPGAPQLSCLALAPGGGCDGRLELHELFALDWRGASLVTLSACSSGKGRLGAGDDLVGLARGFLFAGAPSVLCSLWDVDDEATRALMVGFYRYYLKGEPKPTALRHAQLDLMADPARPQWSRPCYWAAFELIGDYK